MGPGIRAVSRRGGGGWRHGPVPAPALRGISPHPARSAPGATHLNGSTAPQGGGDTGKGAGEAGGGGGEPSETKRILAAARVGCGGRRRRPRLLLLAPQLRGRHGNVVPEIPADIKMPPPLPLAQEELGAATVGGKYVLKHTHAHRGGRGGRGGLPAHWLCIIYMPLPSPPSLPAGFVFLDREGDDLGLRSSAGILMSSLGC